MALELRSVAFEMGVDPTKNQLQSVALELGYPTNEPVLQSFTLIVESDPTTGPPEGNIPTVAIERAPRTNWKGK